MCTQTRECNKCGKTLPLTEQYFAKNQSTNTGGNKYFRPDCKVCNKKMNQDKNKAYKNAGSPIPPNFGYDKKTKRTTNGYPCDCCGKTTYPKQIVFDHDHSSLEHRGWVCDTCNRSIGILGDDIDGLSNALSYITGRKVPTDKIKLFIENYGEVKNGII